MSLGSRTVTVLNRKTIQQIADEVVKELESDYEEKVYQEAFLAELRLRGYEYDRERVIPVLYKGQQVGFVKADVVARKDFEEVVLELKVGGDEAVKQKIRNELMAYLRAIRKSQPKDGVKRAGFVVMFPCTPDKKKDAKPPEKAKVDEVKVMAEDGPDFELARRAGQS